MLAPLKKSYDKPRQYIKKQRRDSTNKGPSEAWCGISNLHNSRRTSLMLLFFSLWITHQAGMGLDFIMIVPLLTSPWGFFFVFRRGISIFGRFQHLMSTVVQQLVLILVLLQEEMSTHPSTLPSWTSKIFLKKF